MRCTRGVRRRATDGLLLLAAHASACRWGTKRIPVVVRCKGVTVKRPPDGAWVSVAGPAVAALSWQAGLLVVACVVAAGVLRLLTQRQQHKMFVEVVSKAPADTEVTEHEGPGGRLMHVAIGRERPRAVQPNPSRGDG